MAEQRARARVGGRYEVSQVGVAAWSAQAGLESRSQLHVAPQSSGGAPLGWSRNRHLISEGTVLRPPGAGYPWGCSWLWRRHEALQTSMNPSMDVGQGPVGPGPSGQGSSATRYLQAPSISPYQAARTLATKRTYLPAQGLPFFDSGHPRCLFLAPMVVF